MTIRSGSIVDLDGPVAGPVLGIDGIVLDRRVQPEAESVLGAVVEGALHRGAGRAGPRPAAAAACGACGAGRGAFPLPRPRRPRLGFRFGLGFLLVRLLVLVGLLLFFLGSSSSSSPGWPRSRPRSRREARPRRVSSSGASSWRRRNSRSSEAGMSS